MRLVYKQLRYISGEQARGRISFFSTVNNLVISILDSDVTIVDALTTLCF